MRQGLFIGFFKKKRMNPHTAEMAPVARTRTIFKKCRLAITSTINLSNATKQCGESILIVLFRDSDSGNISASPTITRICGGDKYGNFWQPATSLPISKWAFPGVNNYELRTIRRKSHGGSKKNYDKKEITGVFCRFEYTASHAAIKCLRL